MSSDSYNGFRIATALRQLTKGNLPLLLSIQYESKYPKRLKVVAMVQVSRGQIKHGYSFNLNEDELEQDPVAAVAAALEEAAGADF